MFLSAVVDLNCTSQKRCRDSEDCDNSAKKICLQGANAGKAQTPKPTGGNSLCSSLVPPSRNSTVLEMSPKTTDGHLCTEPVCGQSTYSTQPSSTIKPTQSSCASFKPSMGAKQAYINLSQNHVVKLTDLRSPSKPDGEILRKRGEENDKRCKSSTLSSEVPQKHASSSPLVQLDSHQSSHTNNTSASPVRTPSRVQQMEGSRKSDSSTRKPASKSNSSSLSCRRLERNKTSRPRRPVVKLNDIDELFTPDPMTYVVSPAHKTAKPKADGGLLKSPSSEKGCSSSTVVSSSSPPVTGSLCRKAQNSTGTCSPHAENTTNPFSSGQSTQILVPTVCLERVNLLSCCSRDNELKNSPITSTDRQLKDESVKTDENHKSLLLNNMKPCALKTDTAACQQTSTSCRFPSALLERKASEGERKQVYKEDPIDVELDLGLSFALDLDLTQSSHSSEEEQLLSLQEMMARVTKPPETPEKGAFSEPSTPGHHSCQSKTVSFCLMLLYLR